MNQQGQQTPAMTEVSMDAAQQPATQEPNGALQGRPDEGLENNNQTDDADPRPLYTVLPAGDYYIRPTKVDIRPTEGANEMLSYDTVTLYIEPYKTDKGVNLEEAFTDTQTGLEPRFECEIADRPFHISKPGGPGDNMIEQSKETGNERLRRYFGGVTVDPQTGEERETRGLFYWNGEVGSECVIRLNTDPDNGGKDVEVMAKITYQPGRPNPNAKPNPQTGEVPNFPDRNWLNVMWLPPGKDSKNRLLAARRVSAAPPQPGGNGQSQQFFDKLQGGTGDRPTADAVTAAMKPSAGALQRKGPPMAKPPGMVPRKK